MDDQLRSLCISGGIRGLIVEAVIQLGVGHQDEPTIEERSIHHLLDLVRAQHNLLLQVKSFILKNCNGSDICSLPVVDTGSPAGLPVQAACSRTPCDLGFIKVFLQAIDAQHSIVAREIAGGPQ